VHCRSWSTENMAVLCRDLLSAMYSCCEPTLICSSDSKCQHAYWLTTRRSSASWLGARPLFIQLATRDMASKGCSPVAHRLPP
jgi:hypothetical protein